MKPLYFLYFPLVLCGAMDAGDPDVDSNDDLFELDPYKSYWMTVNSPTLPQFHNQVIHADENLKFSIGIEKPVTFCGLPEAAQRNCPYTGKTLVNSKLTDLKVLVPGGQKIYVISSGDVVFTAAHDEKRNDMVSSTWVKQISSTGDPIFNWSGSGGWCHGLLVCAEDGANNGRYTLVTSVCNINKQKRCEKIEGIQLHADDAHNGAWQYGYGAPVPQRYMPRRAQG